MSITKKPAIITMNGKSYTKHIILADVNIPYKFSLDRIHNKLFFCINADEFSDQSFQSVILDLNSGAARIIPGIRNGFASAIDNSTGRVYLGGSSGIYEYNYQQEDIEKPAIVAGIDIFDMFYKNGLYYVDTTNLDLHVLKNNYNSIIKTVEEYGIHHVAVDANENIMFANSVGLFILRKGFSAPERLYGDFGNIRSITTDVNGSPYFIAQDGIYFIDVTTLNVTKVLSIDNGYGLAFDKDNNIIYGEERYVAKLLLYDGFTVQNKMY